MKNSKCTSTKNVIDFGREVILSKNFIESQSMTYALPNLELFINIILLCLVPLLFHTFKSNKNIKCTSKI